MHHPIQQIWSISEGQFNTTKTVSVKNKVSSTFNVDWDHLEYDELTVPTYSALALFLFLEHSNEFPIPFSIDDQAEIYHRITNFPVDGFKDGVSDIDQNTQNECRTMALDIVFVVDVYTLNHTRFNLFSISFTRIIFRARFSTDTCLKRRVLSISDIFETSIGNLTISCGSSVLQTR